MTWYTLAQEPPVLCSYVHEPIANADSEEFKNKENTIYYTIESMIGSFCVDNHKSSNEKNVSVLN